MNVVTSLQIMATYNQRINSQLLNVCKQLDEQQLNRDMGGFFPTIMAHWNHILFGDLIMMQRLRSNGYIKLDDTSSKSLPEATAVDDTFVESFDELIVLRKLVDTIYCQFTSSLDQETCNKDVEYVTTEGQSLSRNLAAFCQHIFNHQTHHRGQLTCLLSQLGLDYGCMDLPVIVPNSDY